MYTHLTHMYNCTCMQELLRELEQFAFQGCGSHMTYDTAASGENVRKLWQ